MLIQILAVLGIIVAAIGGYSYATTGTPLGAYSVFVSPLNHEVAKVHSATALEATETAGNPSTGGNDPVGPLAVNETCSVDFPYNVSAEYVKSKDIANITFDKNNKPVINYKDIAVYRALVSDDDCQTEFRGRVDILPTVESNVAADIKLQISKGKLILEKSKQVVIDPIIRSKFVLTR